MADCTEDCTEDKRQRRNARKKNSALLVTANTTSRASAELMLKRGLASLGAAVGLIQEAKVPRQAISTLEDACLRAGYATAINPCTGQGQTASAGTAVAAQWHWGLGSPAATDGPHLVTGRVSLMVWNGALVGGILAGTVYCQDGAGAAGNWHILGPLGEALTAMGRPFVIGGDWNMEPNELDGSGWPARIGPELVRPRGVNGTRRTTGGLRMYDYFAVSTSLLGRVLECTVLDWPTSPHHPVGLRLRCGGPEAKVRTLHSPRAFPREAPVGPSSAHVDCAPLQRQCLQASQESELREAFRCGIREAERALCGAMHIEGDEGPVHWP